MKLVLVVFALIIGGSIALYTILQNGIFLRYLDAHPDPKKVPTVEYYIGESYYIMGDLQNSATYYLRISERYPKSGYADDAYFNYLQSIDDMKTPLAAMADAYSTYLERFPGGNHTEIVQKRIDYCRNSH